MSGSTRSSADLDMRRRRVLFRAWHRGLREMDLILGRFADERLPSMTDDDLADFEQLIEVPDRDLFGWLIGDAEAPANYDTPVFRALKTFHTHAAPLHA